MISVFAGKGGVGKTTCAAASAIHYASLGELTLVISTDATPSLSHIFETTERAKPAKVAESLYINELGLAEVKELWNKKFGREVYEVFSSFVSIEYGEFLDFMTSLLPGLAEEFMVDYIRELDLRGDYDTIIWDSAPLGQTLSLLETPAMMVEHLKIAPKIYSRLKRGSKSKESVLEIIKRWRSLSRENVDFLSKHVKFTLVTIPEALAVQQLDGIFAELNRFGFKVTQLIINNVVKEPDSGFLTSRAQGQEGYIRDLKERFSGMRIVELPMFPKEVRGIDRLKPVSKILFGENGGGRGHA
jgi:arsenite-transporting ATPase